MKKNLLPFENLDLHPHLALQEWHKTFQEIDSPKAGAAVLLLKVSNWGSGSNADNKQ